MLHATWRSLWARKIRLFLSALAVILGVSFVAGSYIFTDTLNDSFTKLTEGGVSDVVIQPSGADSLSGEAPASGVPADLVDKIAEVPGVARVDGTVSGYGVYVVGKNNKVAGGFGPGIAVNAVDVPAANGVQSTTLVSGDWPKAEGEITLDETTAKNADYALGDTVPLVTAGREGKLSGTLVGTINYGSSSMLGASIVGFYTPQAQSLFAGGTDKFTAIAVNRKSDVTQKALAAKITPLLPDGVEAETGDAASAEIKSSINEALSFVTTFLLVFAAVALIVGSFIIVNTFSILVAQRSRELALFRAIGATRRQVSRMVLIEAIAIGLIGSGFGVLLGFGLAEAIRLLFGTIGLDLGGDSLVLQTRTVIVSFAVGVIITVLAAYLPARKAGRIAPVAAMRDDVALAEGGLRWRLAVGLGFLVLGAAGVAAGFAGWTDQPVYILGAGAFGLLVGTALISPVIGRPVIAGLGALYRRFYGSVGVMATANTTRNPRRTAATASALMIGVALVAMMSVLGASSKASIDKALATDVTAPVVVSDVVGTGFSPSIGDEISQDPDVAVISRARQGFFEMGDEKNYVTQQFINGLDPATVPDVGRIELTRGSIEDLTEDTVFVTESYLKEYKLKFGDTLTGNYAGEKKDFTIAGLYKTGGLAQADITLSLDGFDALGVPPTDSSLFVVPAEGVSSKALIDKLVKQTADRPTVAVKDQAAYAADQSKPVDQILYIVYGLLGLAVVIAILGIINTLALSVSERVREIGLLRAVGLTRRQLRRMLRLESVAIAILGAILGIGLGLLMGIALQSQLVDQGITELVIPGWQLALFVGLAGLVGVLASVVPGWRASKMNILRSISTE